MEERSNAIKSLWKDAERIGMILPFILLGIGFLLSLLMTFYLFNDIREFGHGGNLLLIIIYLFSILLVAVTSIPFVRGRTIPIGLLVLYPFLFFILFYLLFPPDIPEASEFNMLPFLEKGTTLYERLSDISIYRFKVLILTCHIIITFPFIALSSFIALKEKRTHKKLSFRLLVGGGILLTALVSLIFILEKTLPLFTLNWSIHSILFPFLLVLFLSGLFISISSFKFYNLAPEFDEKGASRLTGIYEMSVFSFLLLAFLYTSAGVSYGEAGLYRLLSIPILTPEELGRASILEIIPFIIGIATILCLVIVAILSQIPLIPHLINHLKRWRGSAFLSAIFFISIFLSVIGSKSFEPLIHDVMQENMKVTNSGIQIPYAEGFDMWDGEDMLLFEEAKVSHLGLKRGDELNEISKYINSRLGELAEMVEYPLISRDDWFQERRSLLCGISSYIGYDSLFPFMIAAYEKGYTRFGILSSELEPGTEIYRSRPIPNILRESYFIFDDPFSYDEEKNLLPEIAIEFDGEGGATITTWSEPDGIYISGIHGSPDYFSIRDSLHDLKRGREWLESLILVPFPDMTVQDLLLISEFLRTDEELWNPLFPELVLSIFPWEGFPLPEELLMEEKVQAKEKEGVSGASYLILDPVDKSIIDEVIKRNLPQIRYCYQRELPRNPTLSGGVTVEFEISASGDVNYAKITKTTLENEIIENCIIEKFKKFRFPALHGGATALVRYPFNFKPLEEK